MQLVRGVGIVVALAQHLTVAHQHEGVDLQAPGLIIVDHGNDAAGVKTGLGRGAAGERRNVGHGISPLFEHLLLVHEDEGNNGQQHGDAHHDPEPEGRGREGDAAHIHAPQRGDDGGDG